MPHLYWKAGSYFWMVEKWGLNGTFSAPSAHCSSFTPPALLIPKFTVKVEKIQRSPPPLSFGFTATSYIPLALRVSQRNSTSWEEAEASSEMQINLPSALSGLQRPAFLTQVAFVFPCAQWKLGWRRKLPHGARKWETAVENPDGSGLKSTTIYMLIKTRIGFSLVWSDLELCDFSLVWHFTPLCFPHRC